MVSTSNITEFSKRKPPNKSKKLSAANIQNIREAAAAAKRKRNAKDEAKRKRGRSIPRRMKNTAVSTARYVKRKITGKSKYKNLTKYEENRAATKIQAAARGYMTRKAVIGLTAAQKRALNPVVSNNIFYNAPKPPSRLSVAVGKLLNGTRSAAGAVLKIYPKIEKPVLDKVVELAKHLATQQGKDFIQSFGNIVIPVYLTIYARKVPGIKAIFNTPKPPTATSIASSAFSAWLQYWSPASFESKMIFEILFTPDFVSGSGLSIAGFAFRVVTAVIVAVAFLTRKTPHFKMSSMVTIFRAFFMEKALEVVKGKARALRNTPKIIYKLVTRRRPAASPQPYPEFIYRLVYPNSDPRRSAASPQPYPNPDPRRSASPRRSAASRSRSPRPRLAASRSRSPRARLAASPRTV